MAKRGLFAVLTAVLWTTVVSAHHPFSADFDMTQQITLTGNITKVEWQNPHVYAYVDGKDHESKVVNWKVEMGSPAELTKAGWTRTLLVTGDAVTVKAWKSKSNPALVNADSFTVRGKAMTAASSFYAAPTGQLAGNDSRPSEQSDPSAASQPTGTAGTQELPSTAGPLALYLLLGGLSLAGALGLRASR